MRRGRSILTVVTGGMVFFLLTENYNVFAEVWSVPERHEITNNYGTPQWDQAFHNGIDISGGGKGDFATRAGIIKWWTMFLMEERYLSKSILEIEI